MPAQTASDLPGLLTRVCDARRAMARARRTTSSQRIETGLARHELIDALEAYTSGLAMVNSPVPYRLRDELRLNRALDASS
jgi:hypothetical protein